MLFFPRMLCGLLLLLSATGRAAESPKQLAARHLCFGCHAVDETRVGPGFQDVAERYANRKDAVPYLISSLRKGSSGKWGGSVAMPPEPVPEAELRIIAQWIMQQ
ncbi:MAG: cytochrome [Proteobacteria bacterium]|nr:cytochrome [Pseudomonadota bacterium]